ncbi:hypothetical protein NCAS_0I03200 [Naumovozyma castellii]|uniref:Uncharacterized protein n=1 Tax=Naumovozyma castellii TaxID=27288 RepID=G0VKF4_NAUCA|nr:hypothetical protein NCAS_0I03200 [Naumovozyma castellii CBS 4309]CCC71988.1 hypothetical protein NCAS_0I03200 [Naumovozyma castellii CBS 4309]
MFIGKRKKKVFLEHCGVSFCLVCGRDICRGISPDYLELSSPFFPYHAYWKNPLCANSSWSLNGLPLFFRGQKEILVEKGCEIYRARGLPQKMPCRRKIWGKSNSPHKRTTPQLPIIALRIQTFHSGSAAASLCPNICRRALLLLRRGFVPSRNFLFLLFFFGSYFKQFQIFDIKRILYSIQEIQLLFVLSLLFLMSFL